jgi:hypothetical protein
MSFREDLPLPEPSPDDEPENGGYPILEAYDELMLARGSEVYLDALECYIYQNVARGEVKDHLFQFLKLYRAENKKGIDRVADILKQNLRCYCDCEGNHA